ncbi:hypothetical protein [Variovorax sp. UMC13]|uniref:hypothetical protein n=1 Tax=Variovorax sp. UMC13 TaxID=1862326 RepID=UPI0016000379|nr:hypothetical protein [Variovorax sp. UMC13]
MKNRQILSFALAVGVGGAFVAPFAAYAEAPSHFAPNEAGVVYHPADAGRAKTEAEAAADLAAARAKPEWAGMLRWGSLASTPKVGPSKTRAEVVAELEAAQKQPNWDAAARLGAPLTAPKVDTSKVRAQAQP